MHRALLFIIQALLIFAALFDVVLIKKDGGAGPMKS